MEKKISISCKCTTYGRVEFLEEALYSYLNQDYDGESEFLIVNDLPLQTLHFDHPNVRIINLKETFPMIGMKEDFAISECRFQTVYSADDDDWFLSNTLNQINKYFPGHQLLHWNSAIKWVGKKIVAIGAVGNCGIVYDKEFVKETLGTYYCIEHEGADMSLVRHIQRSGGKIARVVLPDEDVCQGYSWGNGSYHLSGQGKYYEGKENIIIRHSRHIEELRKQGKIPTGDIELKPHWKFNYKQMLSDYLNDIPESKRINYGNLGGWAIEGSLLNWILSRVAKGSSILEFGSGTGTVELAKFYDVTTVEHNPKWIGHAKNAKYVYSKISNGWYDMVPVYEAIKRKDIKLIIVDGPPGAGNRNGFLDHVENFRNVSIIIDDTNRPPEAEMAKKVSQAVHRKNFTIKGHEKSFDVI